MSEERVRNNHIQSEKKTLSSRRDNVCADGVRQPLISIITITYNAGKELPATMQSVVEQTFHDYEHILIDGASKDNTLEIASGFHRLYQESLSGETDSVSATGQEKNKKDEEVSRKNDPGINRSIKGNDSLSKLRIYSEPDKGLYDAMNKGLRKARGKYILFLNAGDAIHEKKVLEAYAEASKSDPDIIYADTVIVDEKRNLIGPRHLSVPEKLTYKSFSKGMLVCHQAFMVKRALTPEYDLTYRFSADYDWTLKCLKQTDATRCVNLKLVAIDYLTNGTTDKNKLKSLRERFRIMSRNYGLLPTVANHISFIFRALKRKL